MSEGMRCPGCGAEFNSYDTLIDHVVEAHEANCQMCGAELASKEELLKHNKEIHGV
jgi:transcription elongation factor Elf1